MSKSAKTKAKRIGIKLAFAYGENQLAITSFGRGNEAKIAVQTDRRGSNLTMPHATRCRFSVRQIDENIDLTQGALETLMENPAEQIREDYLGLKSTLEKEFFGQEFPHDTVRIQIIHNLLDVEKILGMYINDAIYCINNLQDTEDFNDVLGLGDGKVKTALKEKMAPYLGFFGDVFDSTNAEAQQNLQALQALSLTRHFTAHSLSTALDDSRRWSLFASSTCLEKHFSQQWKTIDQLYSKMVDRVNSDFKNNSKTNLAILFSIFKDEAPIDIITEYYHFCILKDGKNLGVNMRKLRELIIDGDASYQRIKDKEHDSYRSKIYTIVDFILFHKLRGTKTLEGMVEQLRCAENEEAKEEMYSMFAQIFAGQTRRWIQPLLERQTGRYIYSDTKIYPPADLDQYDLKKVLLQSSNVTQFVKLISFLCNFMEGKEVNELLSAYIHKFECIQSFIDTLKELGEEVKFSSYYALLNEENGQVAGKIAQQLRVLASIGKMKPDLSQAKRALYKAAILMLGVPDDSDRVSDQWLAENVLPDKDNPRKSEIHKFRNFIANNVINSRRFMYLVRYTKPKTVRALMSNRRIVFYVLKRLDTQIDAYYRNIKDPVRGMLVTKSEKINTLTKMLTGLSFDQVEQQRTVILENTTCLPGKKIVSVEQLKALIGLYLTVAYVAVKNLIKTNARYYIAYSVFERDYAMFEKKVGKEKMQSLSFPFETDKGKTCYNEVYALIEYFLQGESLERYQPGPGKSFSWKEFREHMKRNKGHYTLHWREILRQNIDSALKLDKLDANGKPIRQAHLSTVVRNHAAHLNVMTALTKYVGEFRKEIKGMRSYFELYHFLIQKLLLEDENLQIPEEKQQFIRSGVPCLDLIKQAYVALGYNLPRYKNLTIEGLFDEDSASAREIAKEKLEKAKAKKNGQL